MALYLITNVCMYANFISEFVEVEIFQDAHFTCQNHGDIAVLIGNQTCGSFFNHLLYSVKFQNFCYFSSPGCPRKGRKCGMYTCGQWRMNLTKLVVG